MRQFKRIVASRRGPAIAACALALLAGVAAGPASSQERADANAAEANAKGDTVKRIIPYPADVTVLDNGLKVILMPMPSNGLVAYWTIVRTGSRDEYERGRSGFAHFFEHMMFRGTERYPADVYQRIITEIGANANAFTTDDLTAYHISVAAEDLDKVVDIESDRFKNLAYTEPAFKTEAGAVYGEYRKSRTDPLFTLYEKLLATAFERHPYGHTTLGYEADIAAMPTLYDYSREFFARYYRPENTVLFIAGDIDESKVLESIKAHYGDWKPGYVPPTIPAEPPQHGERHVDVTYDGQTLPILWVSYKLDRFDPQNGTRVAADLLADLAFGPTSDAYKRLVLDEQVVEFLEAGANQNRDPTLFDIYTRIKDPAKVDYVLGVIDETVDRYRRSPPDAKRLADLKSREKYGFVMGLDTPEDVAQRLARFIAISGGVEGAEALYEAYDKVTPADVQAAAERYLDKERRTVGVLRSAQ
ncbi:MAG TPA: pitrilysin family protein [Gammaproteobacteria bacterium]|nr:pitrilysin family protein [Gammaproteobacteria bacterium]